MGTFNLFIYLCMHMCMRFCMCICICVYTWICMCVCVYVCKQWLQIGLSTLKTNKKNVTNPALTRSFQCQL